MNSPKKHRFANFPLVSNSAQRTAPVEPFVGMVPLGGFDLERRRTGNAYFARNTLYALSPCPARRCAMR